MSKVINTNDMLSRALRKIDAFLERKRVVFTKPYKDLTDQQKKKLKPKQWTDKQGNIKPFVKLQVMSIHDL